MRASSVLVLMLVAAFAAGCAAPEESGMPPANGVSDDDVSTTQGDGTAPGLDGAPPEAEAAEGVPRTNVTPEQPFEQAFQFDDSAERVVFSGVLDNAGEEPVQAQMSLSGPGEAQDAATVEVPAGGAAAIELAVTNDPASGEVANGGTLEEQDVPFTVVLRVQADAPVVMSGSFYESTIEE